MRKILLLYFWFGKKNRTCGFTYSCFGNSFQGRNWGNSREEGRKLTGMFLMLTQSPYYSPGMRSAAVSTLVGFRKGDELKDVIGQARICSEMLKSLTLYPEFVSLPPLWFVENMPCHMMWQKRHLECKS